MSSRRRFLARAIGAGATLVIAGCSDDAVNPGSSISTTKTPSTTVPPTTVSPSTAPSATVPPSAADIGRPWWGADFDELDQFLDASGTDAFRIVEGGEVIHEWYRNDETFARDVASAQKSVLSLLVGRAIGEGLVALDTPIDEVLGTDWTPHGESGEITVRQLLSMTSGLGDQLEVVAAPGTEWQYSGAFAVLFSVVTTVTGRALNDIADDWLFAPAGAGTAEFYERRNAQFAPIGLVARASDLTAIGQTVLDGSQPGLPNTWLDDSFVPSSAMNESYGYLWWLNGRASHRLPGARVDRRGALIPNAPADLVAALGKDDQKLYISRELDLVVARLGAKASPDVRPALSTFDDPLWALLLDVRSS